jgi:hypothetical protein
MLALKELIIMIVFLGKITAFFLAGIYYFHGDIQRGIFWLLLSFFFSLDFKGKD